MNQAWRVVDPVNGDVLSTNNVRSDQAALAIAGILADRLKQSVRLDYTPDGTEWRPGPVVQPGDIAPLRTIG